MFRSFRNWIQNQKQTRRFHPSWILLVVVVVVVVAGIVWIPAELITRAEHDDRPPAAKLPVGGESSLPREEAPAWNDPWAPAKPIWVDLSNPTGNGIAGGRARAETAAQT